MVVGGGISGLSAARDLCLAGLRVALLEADERCGGKIRTDRVGDFVIDSGPDTLLGHKPAALALCRELGLDASLVPPLTPRTTFVLRRGTLRALPETSAFGFPTDWKALVTTTAFSWRGKARMAAEPLVRRGTDMDESIASFIGRRFGREAVTYLASPLLAGLHKGDATKLSMHALFPGFVDAERTHGSVVRSWRHRTARASSGPGSMSLDGGLGQLVQRLRDTLPSGVVRLGAQVTSIGHSHAAHRPFRTAIADGDTVDSRAVLLSIPPPVVGAVVPALDAELARLARAIRCESSVNVALGYPRAEVRHNLRGWGIVVPTVERRHVTAVSWVSSKWANRAPADCVLFRVSLGGAGHADAIDVSDDEATTRAHVDLSQLLGITAGPALSRVYRWRRAIPQFDVGHLERMAAIDRRLERHPGLFLSAAGFRGVGLPDCIGDARQVARRAILHVNGGA